METKAETNTEKETTADKKDQEENKDKRNSIIQTWTLVSSMVSIIISLAATYFAGLPAYKDYLEKFKPDVIISNQIAFDYNVDTEKINVIVPVQFINLTKTLGVIKDFNLYIASDIPELFLDTPDLSMRSIGFMYLTCNGFLEDRNPNLQFVDLKRIVPANAIVLKGYEVINANLICELPSLKFIKEAGITWELLYFQTTDIEEKVYRSPIGEKKCYSVERSLMDSLLNSPHNPIFAMKSNSCPESD